MTKSNCLLQVIVMFITFMTQASSYTYYAANCTINLTDKYCSGAMSTTIIASIGSASCTNFSLTNQVNATYQLTVSLGSFCVASELALSPVNLVYNSTANVTWITQTNYTASNSCVSLYDTTSCNNKTAFCASRVASMNAQPNIT